MAADVLKPSRRTVLKGSGALLLAFAVPGLPKLAAADLPGSLAAEPNLSSWIRIGADGRVTLLTGKVELGQGIGTALAQIAAEELDVDFARMHVVTADTARTPDEGYTFSSISVQQSGGAIRQAAAEVRFLLIAKAAQELERKEDELTVDDGDIVDKTGEPLTSYWSLIGDRDIAYKASGTVAPKERAYYHTVGTDKPRIDIAAKAFGQPAYLQDIRLENMVHGRVVRPPAIGARLRSVDIDAVAAMSGVIAVVRDGSFLGVVAGREEQAIAAAQALRKSARWSAGKTVPADLEAHMRGEDGAVNILSAKRARAHRPAQRLTASYSRPFQAHASMAPSAAIANFADGALTVYSHSQGIYALRRSLAGFLGMEETAIHIIHAENAGCYGHNGADDAACDAVLLARAVPGRPVRLQWMREDEFMWEPLGSAMLMDVEAALDASGRIVDWRYDMYSYTHSTRPAGRPNRLLAAQHVEDALPPPKGGEPLTDRGISDRNAVPYYNFPAETVTKHLLFDSPARVSALRALGAYANVFAIESFMDELAFEAGIDPLTFRLDHLTDARARRVLQELARLSGYHPTVPRQDDIGRGLAFGRYKNSGGYVGILIDVRIGGGTGEIQLENVYCTVDAGLVISPDGARNQIEGGIIQSLSWTLMEQVSFSQNGIDTRDWSDYPILTFENVPEIEVAFMPDDGNPALGMGELAQGPAAAALANAVFDASNKRIRRLPLGTSI